MKISKTAQIRHLRQQVKSLSEEIQNYQQHGGPLQAQNDHMREVNALIRKEFDNVSEERDQWRFQAQNLAQQFRLMHPPAEPVNKCSPRMNKRRKGKK
jgi:TolA-binding protein